MLSWLYNFFGRNIISKGIVSMAIVLSLLSCTIDNQVKGNLPEEISIPSEEPAETVVVQKPDAPVLVNISYGRENSFNGTKTLNLSVPTGIADGDFLLMMVGSDNGAVWDHPVGWTQLYNDHYSSADGANFNTYFRMASGEPASYAVTATTTTNGAAGWIAAWRGVDPIKPINGQSHNTYYQSDAVTTKTLSATSITTDTDNCQIIFIGYVDENTTNAMTFAVPSGFTLAGSQQDGNNWVTSALGEYTLADKGATGDRSADWDNGRLNSTTKSGVGAILIALKPAPLP